MCWLQQLVKCMLTKCALMDARCEQALCFLEIEREDPLTMPTFDDYRKGLNELKQFYQSKADFVGIT